MERVEPGLVRYETLDGEKHEQPFDFGMLLPPFGGVGLRSFDGAGQETTKELFAPNGFMRVDADYTGKPFERWEAGDWPSTYQTPRYANVFAVGIAFAPPHQISRPYKSPNGTVITPSPPRTGMPSGIMGRAVAYSIADMIENVQGTSLADPFWHQEAKDLVTHTLQVIGTAQVFLEHGERLLELRALDHALQHALRLARRLPERVGLLDAADELVELAVHAGQDGEGVESLHLHGVLLLQSPCAGAPCAGCPAQR